MAASAEVSELEGKSGYCLRGGPGGTNGWIMLMAAMNDNDDFFDEDGQQHDQPARMRSRACRS